MATVVVVGLGPAGPELLTQAARDAIDRIPVRYVRTTRHPSSSAVEGAHSFDDVYERASSLDEVYADIVDALAEAAAASDGGVVLYAVPGSPLVAERTVELLLADDRIDLEVVAGLSFLDLAWARLGVDPVAAGVRVVDGRRFAVEAAAERGPLLVAQCDSKDVLSDIKLAAGDKAPDEVTVLQRLGLPDESVRTVAWADIDRDIELVTNTLAPAGSTATPNGPLPTATVATTAALAVSITDTEAEPLLATYRRVPSGLTTRPSGRVPTAIVPVTVLVAVSMTAIVLENWWAT